MWLDVSRSRRSAAACKPLSLAPAIPLADERGVAALAEGELMRYLAEAAWYPTALLPSQGARWQALDERSARATLSDGSLTLDLSFEFNDAGSPTVVRDPKDEQSLFVLMPMRV